MSLKDRIHDDIKTALKSGEKARLGTLRLVKAQLQTREVDPRAKQGRDYVLDDEEALVIVARAAKQRRESIESFRSGDRDDLAVIEEAELAIIEEYLPEAIGEEELRGMVSEAIAESGATTPKEMGAVMQLVIPKVRGRADGKAVSQMVRELLAGSS